MTATAWRPPRPTQPQEMPAPVVDDLSATVLGEAIDTLCELRTPYWLGDSAVRLHALASQLAQAQGLLPEAVSQARDQDLTWDQIGQLLGLTGPAAARRYRPATPRRPEPCTPPGRPFSPLPPPHQRAAPQPVSRRITYVLGERRPAGQQCPARAGRSNVHADQGVLRSQARPYRNPPLATDGAPDAR